MRKILLWAFMALVALSSQALDLKQSVSRTKTGAIPAKTTAGTFKEMYSLDRLSTMQNRLMGNNSMASRSTTDESELITNPEGNKSRYAMTADIFLSHMGAVHIGGFGADVIISEDNSKFYSRAFTLNFFQQGYSEGTIKADSVVFNTGQYIYDTDEGEKAYMYAAYLAEDEEWPVIVESFVLTKDEQGRYVSAPGYYFMVMTEAEATKVINENTFIISFGTNYVFTPLPDDAADAKLPEDAEVFECQMCANSLSAAGDVVFKDIEVGVSGNEVYIGGLTDYLPGSYLKGTIGENNTITFPSHQYIGYHDEGEYPYIYEFAMVNPIYFDGESLYYQQADSIKMTFNDAHTLLTIEEDAGIFVCSYADLSSWDEVYWNILAGDLNQSLTAKEASDVAYYNSSETPYICFEWSNTSVEGLPLNTSNLWCELEINGEIYEFKPEYYEGLPEATERVYYTTSGVDGLYPGDLTTLYLNEFKGNSTAIRTIGVRIGYQSNEGVGYTNVVYAKGFEPIEDKAYVPSTPNEVVYFKDYYTNFTFKYDGKDAEGNVIPDRLLGVEVLLDGEPLVFKNSDYYFNGSTGEEVTVVGLSEYSPNYSSSLVKHYGDKYILSLWGSDEIPEFKNVAIRVACYGGDTLTYGGSCEIKLEREATPANPWDVTYDKDMKKLVFGALPVDVAGNGLAPWNYGYEVYVNNDLYTFKGDLYELENDITLIPYEGFEYNYSFYLHTEYIYNEADWTVIDEKVVMDVSMLDENLDVQKIGVRAVYTDENGNKTYSEIVNSDGSTGTTGIDSISKAEGPVKWYNLQGVEVANPVPGAIYLRQQNGKTTKVFVK